MTKLEDGPAKGQVLMLRRAPLFLRVSFVGKPPDGAIEWDALDLLDDAPREDEVFYAYQRIGQHGRAFIDFGGKKKHLSGLYTSASYIYVEEQPSQKIMSDNDRWREWCRKEARENLVAHSG